MSHQSEPPSRMAGGFRMPRRPHAITFRGRLGGDTDSMAQRTCWHCEQNTHMTPNANSVRSTDKTFWSRAYSCDNCTSLSVAVLVLSTEYRSVADERFETPGAPIEWFPVRLLGRRFDDVPQTIAEAASEAYACYSIRSYRAAVLLARAVVEAVAKDKGKTKGNLKTKIDGLESDRLVNPQLAETAHEIRFIGNDMAHGDFITEITEEECDDVLNFMTSLLEEIYQRPAKLSRFREQRLRRNEQEDAEAAPIV